MLEYRIIHEIKDGKDSYEIAEVFTNYQEELICFEILGNISRKKLENLEKVYREISIAFTKPVLERNQFEWQLKLNSVCDLKDVVQKNCCISEKGEQNE